MSSAHKILIVDDDEGARYALRRTVERLGYEVATAATGQEALERASEDPALILLDVHLPDLSGFEVVERLRQEPATAHIPVVHLSAVFADPLSQSKGLNRGADAYLVSPTEPTLLGATIKAQLRVRRAERAARAAALEWEETFAAIEDAVFVTSPDGAVRAINPSGAALFGQPAEAQLGRPCEAVCPFVGQIEGDGCPLLPDGDTAPRRHEFAAEQRYWVEKVSPVRDLEGDIQGYVHVLTDVTPIRLAEEERREAAERLAQSHRLESMGRLAGGLSHDFNNLLAVITGTTELLLSEPGLPSSVREDLETIREATARGGDLVRQIMAFGRQQLLSRAAIDLDGVVREMLPVLRHSIREDIRVEAALQGSLPPVTGDRGQMEQVLLNLVLNAGRATEGFGRIRIRTEVGPCSDLWLLGEEQPLAEERFVALHVEDEGSGMTEEVRQRAVEPFFTTAARGEGSGLGLSSVWGIARQHGGHLAIASEPGTGTRVSVYLPVAAEADRNALRPPSGPKPGEALAATARSLRVLVAEDDPQVRRMLERLLTRSGHDVTAVSDGEQAWHHIAEHGPPDVLLSDVVMPHLGGAGLVQRVFDAGYETAVLLISGHADPEVQSRIASFGDRVRLVRKPFEAEDLLGAIQRLAVRRSP